MLMAWLVAVFIKPALLLTVAAAVAWLLRRNTAAARHALWAGAVIVTLGLPALSQLLPEVRVVSPLVPVARSVSARPVFPSEPAPVSAVPAPAAPSEGRSGPAFALADEILLSLWLAGVLLFRGRRLGAGIRLRRWLRQGKPLSRAGAQVEGLVRAAGVRQEIRVQIHPRMRAPAVTGIGRPVILLPEAAEDWPERDLVAVLQHEIAHIARRDCGLNLAADLAAIVYWCNPLVRHAVRQMRAESERACDDLVIRHGAEPERYAHLLLGLARAAQATGGLPDGVTAMARPRELESRLLAVMDERIAREPVPGRLKFALASLGVLLALPAAALTAGAAPLQIHPIGTEPDRLADSVAAPLSERVTPVVEWAALTERVARLLNGPDSVLARHLLSASEREPKGAEDLVRERAAWALAQEREGRLIEPLMSALESDNWRVQAYAAWTLGVAREPAAVPGLIRLLGHPVWRLRAMAAYALSASGDRRAETVMQSALADPAWQVRIQAVEYFAAFDGSIRAVRLTPRLEDRHVAVRLAARDALTLR